ncbi:MAG: DUF2087 domain-containing protein [Armatimonadetes bacterium]|nr:DUF2087 domain-containing protein [Armatimonadota bacterium]
MPDDRGARSDARARRKWPPPVAADRDPKMMEALVAALEPWSETGDSDTRLRAIRAIGLMPVQTGLATIQRHVRDPLAHVRVAAIRALAVRADTAAARTLAEVAAQDSASEKLAAVQALGAAGDTECLPILDTLACEAEQAIASAARVSAQAVEHRAAPPVPTAPDKRFRMAEHVRGGRTPGRFVSLEAGLTALPADRAYNEPELTRFIAGECWDYSSVRRYLVEEGLLSRSQGAYSLTEFGRTAWRVERALAALPEHEVSEAPET